MVTPNVTPLAGPIEFEILCGPPDCRISNQDLVDEDGNFNEEEVENVTTRGYGEECGHQICATNTCITHTYSEYECENSSVENCVPGNTYESCGCVGLFAECADCYSGDHLLEDGTVDPTWE